MNESGQNFDELKKLLKLKRHEVPPPGFFNHFSDEIVARIRAGEGRGGGTFLERLNDQAPWFVNFIRVFEARPGVIGGFATGLCLLLLLGVVLAEHSDTGSPMLAPAVASTGTTSTAVATAVASTPAQFASAMPSEGGIAMSTNASLQPVTSMFGQPGDGASLFQPVSFAPAH